MKIKDNTQNARLYRFESNEQEKIHYTMKHTQTQTRIGFSKCRNDNLYTHAEKLNYEHRACKSYLLFFSHIFLL